MMKTYNLKTEFNWRGDVAELLAKFRYGARRTKGYEFERHPCLSPSMNLLLKKIWKSIDLYSVSASGQLIVYEVKSRSYGITRRPDITNAALRACQKALSGGARVYVITVTFHEDWEISFSSKPFEQRNFRINDGGWYRQKLQESLVTNSVTKARSSLKGILRDEGRRNKSF